MRKSYLALISLFFCSCQNSSIHEERVARQQVLLIQSKVSSQPVSNVTESSSLEDFVLFALYNHPKVKAAYYDWIASVEEVTIARSLPDPKFIFELDLQKSMLATIFGLKSDFFGSGKLRLAGRVASSASQAKYFAFEKAILESAFELKKAYFRLDLAVRECQLARKKYELLLQEVQVAQGKNIVGKNTFADLIALDSEKKKMSYDVLICEEKLTVTKKRFQAALGRIQEEEQLIPCLFEYTSAEIKPEFVFSLCLQSNPQLQQMRAELEKANQEVLLAYKSKVSDYMVQIKEDNNSGPVIWSPEIEITLPIYRDKIAAIISQAQAKKEMVTRALNTEEIALGVAFVEKMTDLQIAMNTLELLNNFLKPNAQNKLLAITIDYEVERASFSDVILAQKELLEIEFAIVRAKVLREELLAELNLLVIGTSIEGAPLLR